MKMKTTTLSTIQHLADKYGLVWHPLGDGWVCNGRQQHHTYRRADERAMLVDYMAAWGLNVMEPKDYAIVVSAHAEARP
jgi:hypothetical protein